jgi:hypothetical protein
MVLLKLPIQKVTVRWAYCSHGGPRRWRRTCHVAGGASYAPADSRGDTGVHAGKRDRSLRLQGPGLRQADPASGTLLRSIHS